MIVLFFLISPSFSRLESSDPREQQIQSAN